MNALIEAAAGWVNAGLSFLYPEICQLCESARAGKAEGYVCGGCRAKVEFIEAPYCERCGLPFEGAITGTFECGNCRDADLQFCTARSSAAAKGELLDVIHRYKYHRALWFEPFLSELLVSRAAPELAKGTWDLIVPVPLHPAREREREFNQAERLGTRLSEGTGIPLACETVRRVMPTQTQTMLSRAARVANVRRAFAPGRKKLNGERVVLVDDVLTTGATTSACARVLKSAGAGEVCVWTVGRGT